MNRVRPLPFIRDIDGRRQLVSGYSGEAITAHEQEQELQGQILQLKRERETHQLHANTAAVLEKSQQIDTLEAELLALRQQMGWA